MSQSAIEWTEQTWNPVTGCKKISSGCANCYAETMARRLQAMRVPGYENGFDLTLHEERLLQPLQRRKPTMYFVNSMSDLFHPSVPFNFVDKVFATIQQTPQHVYQILTKRPERMHRYFNTKHRMVPYHAWLGVTVENRKQGLPRIDSLRDIPCQVRFLSCEPLLEDLGVFDLGGIHWVIVGGESGSRARPMQGVWAEHIRHLCRQYQTAFFFKQWGTYGSDGVKRSKKANGRLLQGHLWEQYPI